MKKLYSLLAVLLISIGAMATQYCATPIVSGDKTVSLTCLNPEEGLYTIIITGEGVSGIGGVFCYVNENEPYQLINEGQQENTVVINIKSSTAPQLYTPLYIMMPGEVAFQFPQDVEWVAECGEIIDPGEEQGEEKIIYMWNGARTEEAKAESAEEIGGTASVWLESGTNIVVGTAQKTNWTIKLNKGYKDNEQYSVLISLDEAIAAGDKLTLGAFKTGTSDAVLAIEFNADTADLNQDVVILKEDLQIVSTNVAPEDEVLDIPAEAAGMKFIRLYRKSGGTGIYIAKFMITRGEGGGDPQVDPNYPSTAAPDLEEKYERVATIFSDRYGVAPGADFYPDWQQKTQIEYLSIGDDNYLYYSNFNYQGWQFDPIVVSAMKYLHLAIWTPTSGSLDIVPIYGGPNLKTDDDHHYTLNLTGGQWNEFNIEIAEAFKGLDLSSIFQFKFDIANGINAFAIDNVYFYNPEAMAEDTEKPQDLKVEVAAIGYFDATLKVSATDDSGLVYYVAVVLPAQEGEDATTLGYTVGQSGAELELKLTKLATDTEYGNIVVIALDETGNYVMTTVQPFRTLAGPAPAPQPTLPAENVMSLYSDAYFATAWFFVGSWGQKTQAREVELAEDDNAYMFTDFNFLGWEINGSQPIDISDMKYLHLDVWAPDASAQLSISPIWGSEALVSVGELKAGWNQIDMPLTTWEGINLANVYQLKFDEGKGGTLFIDNVYFHKGLQDALDNTDNAAIRVDNGTITVNAQAGEPIAVYNVAGQMIYQTISTGMNQITLHKGQVVIVRIADKAAKVIL